MNIETEYNLSEEEADIFQKFRKQMKETYGLEAAEDCTLYRFLKAREFNIMQAENMFKNHIAWRKQMKIDTILEDYRLCEVHDKYYKPSHIGYDKKGFLLLYFDVGDLDFRGLLKCKKVSEYVKGFTYIITGYENLMKEQSRKLGKTIDRWTLVLNYENYSIPQALNKPCLDLFFEFSRVYEANYPERIETTIVINASKVFFIIYNMVKHVIPKRTVEKLKIFGKDGWKEELVKLVDEEQLPAFLGGKKTDPDGNPLCLTMVHFNKPVPKHYYCRSPEMRLRGEQGTKEYLVKRMDKAEIIFDVTEPNSCIEWEFESESGDISFGVFKKIDEKKLEPVIPMKRVNAHQYIESDMLLCKTSGIYVLRFDNSYSWFRDKQMFCRASVKKYDE